MFENLSDKLQSVFSGLSNRGKLSEADVDAALREVRLALLEADVNFRVVKDFIKRVRERAVGAEVMRSLTPAQQVVKIVNEAAAGMPVPDVCRKHNISTSTFYKWRAKYGGMDVSDARKLKSLETENARLKRLLADSMLDNVVLKDLLGKN